MGDRPVESEVREPSNEPMNQEHKKKRQKRDTENFHNKQHTSSHSELSLVEPTDVGLDKVRRLQKRDKKRSKKTSRAGKDSTMEEKDAVPEEDSKDTEESEERCEVRTKVTATPQDEKVSRPPTPSTIASSPSPSSANFDVSPHNSASSSITSPPPSPESPVKEASDPCVTDEIKAEQRVRLQARIEALRAARKADNTAGGPARTRQELLESRRQKENNRKALKKEQRRKAREDEARRKAETLTSGSPLLSPSSPRSPLHEGSPRLTFGRVDFGSGEQASANLDTILASRQKHKGPSDPATALIAANKRETKLAGLDPSKREDMAGKDDWYRAKKRAMGEAVRDDSSLLKQTLKRKQKQKKKSEKEWTQRLDGVKKSQEMQQKKRQANLAKRKEAKGQKGKKQKKTKARPGFEGSFRAKAPGPSKKGER